MFIRPINSALRTSHIPITISFVSSMISIFNISLFLNAAKRLNHLCRVGVATLVQLLG
jgi:hypothetical protein